jgi:putative nucleotidyltransferase with HDIG domain
MESPKVIPVLSEIPLPALVERIRSLLPDQELYLVGGAVRDMLLGRNAPDLDFAVPAQAIPLARRLADSLHADYVTLDDQRDTGRVIVTELDGSRTYLDFAAFRSTVPGDTGDALQADLRGRDFTINAMAYDLARNALIDPLEGGKDLRAKRIRACAPEALRDDPVRVLRAARLATALGFQIEGQTRELIREAAPLLKQVSPERQRDELFKILDGAKPYTCLRVMERTGVLPHVLPEITTLKGVQQSSPHIHDVWEHTLAVLQRLEEILSVLQPGYEADNTNDLFTGLLTLRIGRYREQFSAHFDQALNADRSLRSLLFFIALYHDISKPETRTVEPNGRVRFFDHDQLGAEAATNRAAALHLSNDEIERVQTVIQNHMRFHFHTSRMAGQGKEPSRRAIYRFFRDSGAAGPDLVLLGLADLRGTQGSDLSQDTWAAALNVARILLENLWERPHETVAPPRLLDGHELMQQLGIPPGPQLGELLEAIREAQATGKVSDRDAALEFARSWVSGSQAADQNPSG